MNTVRIMAAHSARSALARDIQFIYRIGCIILMPSGFLERIKVGQVVYKYDGHYGSKNRYTNQHNYPPDRRAA